MLLIFHKIVKYMELGSNEGKTPCARDASQSTTRPPHQVGLSCSKTQDLQNTNTGEKKTYHKELLMLVYTMFSYCMYDGCNGQR